MSGLPLDAVTDCPYIKMCSNREITIEDAGKLLHYEKELVKVSQHKKNIVVEGEKLDIVCLANKDIRVCGIIEKISFE